MFGFFHALYAASRLMRKDIQDNSFGAQDKAIHEPATHWRKEGRTEGEDHDPRPDMHEVTFLRIFYHQAGPCSKRDAPQTVHSRRSRKVTDILCNSPDQTWQCPAK